MKKLFIFLLVIAVVALGASFALKKVEEVKIEEENTPFTVSDVNGVVLDNKHDTTIIGGFKYHFKVNKAFTLTMLPSESAKDFYFQVNEANYQFLAELKLLEAFNVELTDDGFSISVPKGANVKSLLQAIYPDKEVEVPEDVEKSTDKLFTLIISEKNGTGEKVEIVFNLIKLSIEMPREIYF